MKSRLYQCYVHFSRMEFIHCCDSNPVTSTTPNVTVNCSEQWTKAFCCAEATNRLFFWSLHPLTTSDYWIADTVQRQHLSFHTVAKTLFYHAHVNRCMRVEMYAQHAYFEKMVQCCMHLCFVSHGTALSLIRCTTSPVVMGGAAA